MDLNDTFKETGVGTSVGGIRGLGAQVTALQAWKPITLGESATKAWSTLGTAAVRKSWGLDSGLLTGVQRHDAIHKNMFGALESQKFLKNSLAAAAPWVQLNKDLTGFQSLASTLNENLGFYNPLKSMVNTGFKVPSLSTDSPLVGLQRNATKGALWDLMERDKQQGLRWFKGELPQRSSLSALAREVARDQNLMSHAEAEVLFQEHQESAIEAVLDTAIAFHEEFAGTETEEASQEFVNQDAALAAKVNEAASARKLTLNQRRALSAYIAFVVYLSFVSMTLYGKVEQPVALEILQLFGILPSPDAAFLATYGIAMKVSKQFGEDSSEDTKES